VLALTCSTVANAWGPLGHRYSGAIADEFLTARAKSKIKTILGMPLKSASTWADCVKDVQRVDGEFKYVAEQRYHAACAVFKTREGRAEMVDYVRRNWGSCRPDDKGRECHKEYHYTDVAIQHDRYDRKYIGTSDHDIVSAINASIAVLQGRPSPAPFDIKNKREALFLLAHLVGDIHQPLHVGAIYLDRSNDPIDPDQEPGAYDPETETRGGNSINFAASNLHADWDTVLRSLNPDSLDPAHVRAARQIQKPTGNVTVWAAKWASDTLVQARKAYAGITYKRSSGEAAWSASFHDRKSYIVMKRKIQIAQLQKAGANLAFLLNEILE
jgi:hypothetical protein